MSHIPNLVKATLALVTLVALGGLLVLLFGSQAGPPATSVAQATHTPPVGLRRYHAARSRRPRRRWDLGPPWTGLSSLNPKSCLPTPRLLASPAGCQMENGYLSFGTSATPTNSQLKPLMSTPESCIRMRGGETMVRTCFGCLINKLWLISTGSIRMSPRGNPDMISGLAAGSPHRSNGSLRGYLLFF